MHEGRESADRYAKNALFRLKGALVVADSNLFSIPDDETSTPVDTFDEFDSD